MRMILYLHGFRSSPASFKARMLEQTLASRGCASQWRCPQLPASPAQALILARQQAHELAHANSQKAEAITLIGSSLGGFYAVCLAEELGCKAVAINPAVYAPRELATQVGEHREYHADRPFVFLPEYVDELHGMARTDISRPDRYLLVAATGDELLDWREMQAFFKGSQQIIIEGSDHGLSDFADHMGAVLAFAGHGQQDAVD
jgi:predicted esterase YcpF (UPF0227 family)